MYDGSFHFTTHNTLPIPLLLLLTNISVCSNDLWPEKERDLQDSFSLTLTRTAAPLLLQKSSDILIWQRGIPPR